MYVCMHVCMYACMLLGGVYVDVGVVLGVRRRRQARGLGGGVGLAGHVSVRGEG